MTDETERPRPSPRPRPTPTEVDPAAPSLPEKIEAPDLNATANDVEIEPIDLPEPAVEEPAAVEVEPAEPAAVEAESAEPVVDDEPVVAADVVADEPVAAEQDVEPSQAPAPAPLPVFTARPAGKRAPWWLAIALGLLTLVLITASVFFATRSGRDTSAAARDQALAAAKQYTAYVISYNYQTLNDDEAKALAHLTGDFANDYRKSMDDLVKPLAPSSKAIIEGTIESGGITAISSDGKQIVCILIASQKTTNTNLAQPRTDPRRLSVTMDRVGKEWKISKVAAL